MDVGFRVAGGAWLACNTSVAGWEESKDLSSKAPRRGKKCADFMRSDQENPPETGTPGKPASRCSVQSTVGKMTNHLTGGPPAKLSRAFVYEFPNKFKPTNVLLKTTHGHVMRACDDMQVRYLNSL